MQTVTNLVDNIRNKRMKIELLDPQSLSSKFTFHTTIWSINLTDRLIVDCLYRIICIVTGDHGNSVLYV